MPRFPAVLLLILALWPVEATASTGAPVRQDEMQAEGGDYGTQALRSAAGLDLVFTLGSRGAGSAGLNSSRSPERSSDDVPVTCGQSILGIRLMGGPGDERAEDAAAPVCELFPYFTTAPPSLR